VYILPVSSSRKKRSKKTKGDVREGDDASAGGEPWWIGKIQEIRAVDERNVYM